MGKFFFITLKGVAFVPWTLGGVLHDILGKSVIYSLLGIWLMVLTHEGVSLVTSNFLRDVLDPFNRLGMLGDSLCLLPN